MAFDLTERYYPRTDRLCVGLTKSELPHRLAAFVLTERRCILGYEEEKVLDEAWVLSVSRKYKLLRVQI